MQARKGTFQDLADHTRASFPVRPGDVVRVYSKINEAGRERIQPFEGIVIAVRGRGKNRSFTLRRVASQGVGVERIFPVNSPYVTKVDILRSIPVRRAKLYYLRKEENRLVNTTFSKI